MAENKTQATEADVVGFLKRVGDDRQREDSFAILEMMSGVTGEKATMWGPSIIEFGDIHLKYDSGRELDWFKVGFPRERRTSASTYPQPSRVVTGCSESSASTPQASLVSTSSGSKKSIAMPSST